MAETHQLQHLLRSATAAGVRARQKCGIPLRRVQCTQTGLRIARRTHHWQDVRSQGHGAMRTRTVVRLDTARNERNETTAQGAQQIPRHNRCAANRRSRHSDDNRCGNAGSGGACATEGTETHQRVSGRGDSNGSEHGRCEGHREHGQVQRRRVQRDKEPRRERPSGAGVGVQDCIDHGGTRRRSGGYHLSCGHYGRYMAHVRTRNEGPQLAKRWLQSPDGLKRSCSAPISASAAS